jgi:hypothetical protein
MDIHHMYFTRFGDLCTYSEYFGQAALRGSAWDGTVRIWPVYISRVKMILSERTDSQF